MDVGRVSVGLMDREAVEHRNRGAATLRPH
jgi:hypothetical protein